MMSVHNNTSMSNSANLEGIYRFMGMLAHEMRTQIAGICTASNILLNEKETRKNTDFYLSHINCMSVNVMHVLNNMMATSITEDGKLTTKVLSERILIRQWLKDQISQYELSANTLSVKIKTSLHRAVPEYIITDEIKLGQILKNLINNALKFAPPGTNVEIHICSLADQCLQFKITDHGDGISADKIPFLFHAFQSLDNGLAGMGLGLYISKLYASALGGDLILERSDKKGTTFLFQINTSQPQGSVIIKD